MQNPHRQALFLPSLFLSLFPLLSRLGVASCAAFASCIFLCLVTNWTTSNSIWCDLGKQATARLLAPFVASPFLSLADKKGTKKNITTIQTTTGALSFFFDGPDLISSHLTTLLLLLTLSISTFRLPRLRVAANPQLQRLLFFLSSSFRSAPRIRYDPALAHARSFCPVRDSSLFQGALRKTRSTQHAFAFAFALPLSPVCARQKPLAQHD